MRLRTGAARGLLSKLAPGHPDAIRLPITTLGADALRQLNAHWATLKRRVLMAAFHDCSCSAHAIGRRFLPSLEGRGCGKLDRFQDGSIYDMVGAAEAL